MHQGRLIFTAMTGNNAESKTRNRLLSMSIPLVHTVSDVVHKKCHDAAGAERPLLRNTPACSGRQRAASLQKAYTDYNTWDPYVHLLATDIVVAAHILQECAKRVCL